MPKRRSDLVSKVPEVVNLEEINEEKAGSEPAIWTGATPLPPGHWEDRSRKEALREKYEEHAKQKLRETLEKSMGKSDAAEKIDAAKDKKEGAGKEEEKGRKDGDPGPDEAESDPSSDESEELESSAPANDPPVSVPAQETNLE